MYLRRVVPHTHMYVYVFFFKLYAFILLTSTIVPGINYFVVTTHPLHQLQVRKRSSSSCYMIETYNTRHRFCLRLRAHSCAQSTDPLIKSSTHIRKRTRMSYNLRRRKVKRAKRRTLNPAPCTLHPASLNL